MRTALCILALVLAGCSSAANTLPPLPAPGEPTRETTLYVPPALDIQWVDFDASVTADTAGGSFFWEQKAREQGPYRGRAFVKVYAVHRETGEQYLLLYEDIDKRPDPVQIIRFEER